MVTPQRVVAGMLQLYAQRLVFQPDLAEAACQAYGRRGRQTGGLRVEDRVPRRDERPRAQIKLVAVQQRRRLNVLLRGREPDLLGRAERAEPLLHGLRPRDVLRLRAAARAHGRRGPGRPPRARVPPVARRD